MTSINELKDNNITKRAIYTCDAKQSLINFIMQDINHNWNTWNYPNDINGIYESPTKKGVFYYKDDNRNSILQAITEA